MGQVNFRIYLDRRCVWAYPVYSVDYTTTYRLSDNQPNKVIVPEEDIVDTWTNKKTSRPDFCLKDFKDIEVTDETSLSILHNLEHRKVD